MRSRRRRFESYDYNDFSMNLYQEYDIDDIRKALWSGGADRAECLSDEQLAEVLSMAFGDRDFVDLTEVNDFVWFSDNIYYVWLGYDSVDEMWRDCRCDESYNRRINRSYRSKRRPR